MRWAPRTATAPGPIPGARGPRYGNVNPNRTTALTCSSVHPSGALRPSIVRARQDIAILFAQPVRPLRECAAHVRVAQAVVLLLEHSPDVVETIARRGQ